MIIKRQNTNAVLFSEGELDYVLRKIFLYSKEETQRTMESAKKGTLILAIPENAPAKIWHNDIELSYTNITPKLYLMRHLSQSSQHALSVATNQPAVFFRADVRISFEHYEYEHKSILDCGFLLDHIRKAIPQMEVFVSPANLSRTFTNNHHVYREGNMLLCRITAVEKIGKERWKYITGFTTTSMACTYIMYGPWYYPHVWKLSSDETIIEAEIQQKKFLKKILTSADYSAIPKIILSLQNDSGLPPQSEDEYNALCQRADQIATMLQEAYSY